MTEGEQKSKNTNKEKFFDGLPSKLRDDKKESFWKFVNSHHHELKLIDFKYIRPNLANISKSLPEDFRNFTDNVNSKESHIVLKAPENGILENIDKSNPAINGLVEYTSEGAGDIKLKIKGVIETPFLQTEFTVESPKP